MNDAVEFVAISAGQFSLSGVVDKRSVPGIVDSAWKNIEAGSGNLAVEVDLSGLKGGDSAALAMLLAWFKRARQRQIKLSYTAFPPELLALARVCGVEELLPVAGSTSPA